MRASVLGGGGVGHNVIKIVNFIAIQCKFNHCLKNFNYKQWCCKIISVFQIRWILFYSTDMAINYVYLIIISAGMIRLGLSFIANGFGATAEYSPHSLVSLHARLSIYRINCINSSLQIRLESRLASVGCILQLRHGFNDLKESNEKKKP